MGHQAKDEKCSKMIWARLGGWGTRRQCSKSATVMVDGQRYCAQHDPRAVEKRDQKASTLLHIDGLRFERQMLLERLFVALDESAPADEEHTTLPLQVHRALKACRKNDQAIQSLRMSLEEPKT